MDITDYLNSNKPTEDFIEEVVGYSTPVFEESKLREKFEPLMTLRFRNGKEIVVFDDDGHAVSQFNKRFNLPIEDLKNTIKKGISKINLGYKMQPDNYVIISRSKDIKVPIDLRPDKYEPDKLIALAATTLHADQVYNTRGETVVQVEGLSNKEIEKRLIEESKSSVVIVKDYSDTGTGMPFQHIFEEGEHTTTFKEIWVD